MNYAVEQRMRLIDFLLNHYGDIGRDEIVDFFGVSTPCVSRDFAMYQLLYPGNMEYNAQKKRYFSTDTFERAFP